ncbi:glycosyltransferase family 2 protein [Desertivirga arenae]|uniref:glycosyltransferase family 2 protein n=1 Tax=Desertivirga arenae TaxID=2810309 RepID=UPI001A968F2E|nr:glycosyltransferase family 2 protein [Pedobacter sp. SYSU D00823]
MNKVSVITVNYNQPKVTEELLHSISLLNRYPDIEIIVVDNGSKNDPVPEWISKYPDVAFIRSDENLGFAGGNNLGIEAATGDYLFLVNNDTEFTPGLIETLVSVLDKNPRVGMVSPKIRFFDQPDTLQYVGFTSMNFNTARNKTVGEFEIDKGQYDNVTGLTGFAHGAAMMVRMSAIKKAGLMFQHFFLYYEEMDWCERIKKAGFEIWVEPRALIYHKESVSVGKKSPLKEFFMNRNRILFIRRNAPVLSRLIFYCHFGLLVSPRNLLKYVKEGRMDLAKQLFRAIWWNITHKKNSSELGFPINKI